MRTVVYAGTREVYHDMETACKSLLYHNGADMVYFLIEDDEFPTKLPLRVQYINVSGQQYFRPDNPNCMKRWTYMSMMRCALPFLFSGRVLWLDTDTLVLDDLSGLWELPDAPIYMARETKADNYFNSGVMLIDCDLMRKDAGKAIDLLNKEEFDYPDQDALNEVMKGRIMVMPPEYNVSDWTIKGKNGTKILHFAAVQNRMHRDMRWRHFERMEWWV